MGGFSNIFQQFWEESVAVRHDVNLIILEGQGQILIDKEVHQGFLTFRHAEIMLAYKTQHRALGQLVHLSLANNAFLTMIDAKKQIEHHAHNRYETDDQHPCHRLGWLTVVHQYMDNGYCSSNHYQCITYVKQSSHLLLISN